MRRATTFASLALLISACTTEIKDLIPQDGPTMVELYSGHLKRTGKGGESGDILGEARRDAAQRSNLDDFQPDPVGYTRTALNETENLFPSLENPALVMHVFPHLAGDERLPVPGYSTSFPLYEKIEFALPGEIAKPLEPKKAKPRIRIIESNSEKTASTVIRSF